MAPFSMYTADLCGAYIVERKLVRGGEREGERAFGLLTDWLAGTIVYIVVALNTVSANQLPSAQTPLAAELGVPLTDAQINAMPSHVFADGVGLPDGSGIAEQGARLYSEHCANCHGSAGQGGKAIELVGDRSLLATDYPDKGIAVYWPYAPTLFEYIDRAMPPGTPGMFSNDQLYSLIAHLLVINGELVDTEVLDKESLSTIRLPNETGFQTIAR